MVTLLAKSSCNSRLLKSCFVSMTDLSVAHETTLKGGLLQDEATSKATVVGGSGANSHTIATIVG